MWSAYAESQATLTDPAELSQIRKPTSSFIAYAQRTEPKNVINEQTSLILATPTGIGYAT